MTELTLLSQTKTFDGWLKRYQHTSQILKCKMVFAIFLPAQADTSQVPLLWWLSGLTCNDENFSQKAGAFRTAAELGLAIVCPDTSPRGLELPGEHDSYDFGSGAGFYVNATEMPWRDNYRMYDYITQELPNILRENFPLNGRESISGHSMGGHGAITIALKNPGRFKSVSAFSPITNPINCPWGQKAFKGYLGADQQAWKAYDSCELIKTASENLPLLIDQGDADNFLQEQLKPEALVNACKEANYPLTLRYQTGYDHSYYFIASFIEEHLRFHAKALNN